MSVLRVSREIFNSPFCPLRTCEDLGLQAKLANSFTILATLLGRGRTSQLNVIYAKVVQRLGNLDLGFCVEEGIGKLLAFS